VTIPEPVHLARFTYQPKFIRVDPECYLAYLNS
jgi:hypothetical protein